VGYKESIKMGSVKMREEQKTLVFKALFRCFLECGYGYRLAIYLVGANKVASL
jgi:hypothetical protein